jgi:DNA adenine methylase
MAYRQETMLEEIPVGAPDKNPIIADTKINPIIKWPGGKTGELSIILPALPPTMERYFEPFLGGSAVFWSISSRIPAFVNDMSSDLMGLCKSIKDLEPDFF